MKPWAYGPGVEGGCSPAGQLRVFGQQKKIWAKPLFKDVFMIIVLLF